MSKALIYCIHVAGRDRGPNMRTARRIIVENLGGLCDEPPMFDRDPLGWFGRAPGTIGRFLHFRAEPAVAVDIYDALQGADWVREG